MSRVTWAWPVKRFDPQKLLLCRLVCLRTLGPDPFQLSGRLLLLRVKMFIFQMLLERKDSVCLNSTVRLYFQTP